MEGYDAGWKWFLRRIAREVAREVAQEMSRDVALQVSAELKRHLYEKHYERLRSLDTMSEKLIYHHLLFHQPQSFTGIRRGLNIGRKTAHKALKKLRERGFVTQDRQFLYWLTNPE